MLIRMNNSRSETCPCGLCPLSVQWHYFSLFYHSEKNKLNIPSNRLANWCLLILLLMRKPHTTFHHGTTTFITIDFISSLAWTHPLLCLHDTREYVEITYSGWCQGPCGCTTSTGHMAGTSRTIGYMEAKNTFAYFRIIKLYGLLLEWDWVVFKTNDNFSSVAC
jgi:hypothetical protein